MWQIRLNCRRSYRPCGISLDCAARYNLFINRTFQTAVPHAGRAIDRHHNEEDFFRYSSGRWLVDEKHQLEQRYVRFNIDNLCSQAASLFSSETRCMRIAKMEGNFSKAFLLTMDDGNEVIAKIPCPNAGPPVLTTECEVATLKFFPEVYHWSSDPTNPVGAEYILMEKTRGVPLAEKWSTLNTLQRYRLIDKILEMEKALQRVQLPAYGGLFLQETLPSSYPRYPLSSGLDPNKQFCIGPSVDLSYTASADPSGQNAGPWRSLLEFALSAPRRELARIVAKVHDVHTDLNRFGNNQSIEEYSDLLQKMQLILPALSQHPLVQESAASSVWHTDLHLGNIFVCPDDPTTIEGIIDWQSAEAAPLFIQARFPEFLRPPKGYRSGTNVPKLPDNFDELGPDEKQSAKEEHTLAIQSKYYEISCRAHNKPVFNAIALDRCLWEPFTRCQLPSNGSLVPLRNSLIRIAENWALLGLSGSSPFQFNEEELKRHDEQVQFYEDSLSLWDLIKEQLGTDNSGWIHSEDWESVNKMNKYLYNMFIDTMSEEISAEEAAKRWPFVPKDA
ncbi:phosphotransferase family protein [Aspergillus costaricaensis CBS 115574]|uniref:Phosphotransferase family protein n=1 Tax=Aspergillus costaricaensis CBS 115574 TaxID=1448317 RepID=A0ACD1I4I1_9EURO|nr:phosphotransferase family protein [Aspergillus costaricaensis CBS 115574]RAK84907.1 phosphotransferase family protein [Aspergillus costaricaensis CBS 115574]